MLTSKDWIPHNLPPRSEFIGREEAKALVHEALRSRSYLISIDGIGGIGKTSLALEVAYECLQVSQYVRQLNQTTSAPEPVFEQDVLDLPPQLYNRLQSTLLKCGPFDSEVELRAMFVDARISPWRDAFPEVRSRVSRVNILIDELLHRYTPSRENALSLFLQVLHQQASAGDACQSDLDALCAELEHILYAQRVLPDPHSAIPALPPDLDVNNTAHFDGFIWVTAKDRELSLNDMLDTVARTLDYAGIIPKPLHEKRIAVEKLLRTQPCLLIVDNFETINDSTMHDFLLNLPEPSKSLITTREQRLGRVWAIGLKGLTENEALTLMRNEGRRLGMQSLSRAKDEVLLHLYQASGGTPLAIKWAVGQISQRGQSLDIVLSALHKAQGNIFDNIFGRSWELLTEDACHVLTVMPLFATSAPRAAIEAASNVRHYALDDALGQLTAMSLVEANDTLELEERRYSLHPLTRSFAKKKGDETPEFLHQAWKRLASFFQPSDALDNDWRWFEPDALQYELDLPNILLTVEWCCENRFTGLAVDIFYHISTLMMVLGYWDSAISLGNKVITLAMEENNIIGAARLKDWPMSWIYRHRGNFALAEELTIDALNILIQFGTERDVAYTKRNLGRISQEREDFVKAEQLVQESLDFFNFKQDERAIHFLTANLANLALQQHNLDRAWELGNSVLADAKRLGYPVVIGELLEILGGVAYQREHIEQAEIFWEESLSYRKQSNRPDSIADVLYKLARAKEKLGKGKIARQYFSQALSIYKRLDMSAKIARVETELAKLSDGH